MKTKKMIISVWLLCCASGMFAQTYYYNTTKTFNENGYAYQCDVKHDRATLYNKVNKYTYTKITYKDGTPLPREVEWGNVYLFEDDEWTKPKCNEIVNLAFSSTEAAQVKGYEFRVSLIVAPDTGKIIEVNFSFLSDGVYATIPVSTYRKIEEGLKANVWFTLTEVGKKVNFVEISWRHEVYAYKAFDTTLPPPRLIFKPDVPLPIPK